MIDINENIKEEPMLVNKQVGFASFRNYQPYQTTNIRVTGTGTTEMGNRDMANNLNVALQNMHIFADQKAKKRPGTSKQLQQPLHPSIRDYSGGLFASKEDQSLIANLINMNSTSSIA